MLNCTTSHAETWTNGVGTVNSVCTCPTSVYNINTLKTPYISFKNSNDHSKWTVGMDKSTPRYLCIGDINRQASQFTRGGGTICINKKPNLAAKYFSFINTVDGCTAGTETEIAKVSYCN
jgi:deoxyribonuclease-2